VLIGVRAQNDFLEMLDEWIGNQPSPKPTRPEGVRRLALIGIHAVQSAPSLDQRIARQEQKLARKIPAKTSPEKGMAVLRKGLAEVEHRKLVEKKKKVDTSGKMRAAEPDFESRPKQAQGKQGSDVQDAKLTRRARVVAKTGKKAKK
jgi:hypothetical protein